MTSLAASPDRYAAAPSPGGYAAHKRMSPQMAQKEDKAKRPKTSSPESPLSDHVSDHLRDDVIAKFPQDRLDRLHLNRCDLKLPMQERLMKYIRACQEIDDENDDHFIRAPKNDLGDTLPAGYGWRSVTGSDDKDYVAKMYCVACGTAEDHWCEECPMEKGTHDYWGDDDSN